MLQGVDAVALQLIAVARREDESSSVDRETWQNVVVANMLVGSIQARAAAGATTASSRIGWRSARARTILEVIAPAGMQ